jgi:lipid A 3-O-deacylase
MVDIALVWDPDLHFWQLGSWDFSLRGELHAAWLRNSEGGDPRNLGAFGVTPLIRFGKIDGTIRPYVEAGVQFADMVGVG